jgi:hypothetical protein
MNIKRNLLVFTWVAVMASFGMLTACSKTPKKVGEECAANKDCEVGLQCFKSKCQKKADDDAGTDSGTEPTPDTAPDQSAPDTTPDTAPDTAPDQSAPDTTPDTAPDQSAPDTAPDTAPDQSAPDMTPDTAPDTAPDATPDTAPDVTPDQTNPDQGSGGRLSLYDILDPQSSKAAKYNDVIAINSVVVTTPTVRLTSSLSAFFVQEINKRSGSYGYGGLMIIFNRTKLKVNAAPGTIVELDGKYVPYRSTDFKSTCTQDSDCASKGTRSKCTDVYDSKTKTMVKRCAEPVAMPQFELSKVPVAKGSNPLPTPVQVKPSDVRVATPTARSLLGVVIEFQSVEVTNQNPDAPKDYSEFSIALSSDKANDIRVDDFLNTVSYTGSKYCSGGCGTSPKNEYCLPGDTCQCYDKAKKKSACYSGAQPESDKRKVGDKFSTMIGVLRFANNNFKLHPRRPTDMVKAP